MQKDKISVIVSVYNVEKYIGRCIESLLSQNHKSYEVIIVDDGSTDGSFDICEGYFLREPSRVRLYRQENRGLSSARNLALSVADGEFVAFVDGDDYLEKNALSTLYHEIKRSRADVAVAGFFEDFADFSKEISIRRGEISFEELMDDMSGRDGYKYVVVWSKLFKRTLFSGLEFPVGKIHEDQYIIHKIYYNSVKTVGVDKHLYHHENREGSISRSSGFVRHMDDIEALFSRAEFLDEKGLSSCQVYVARHMLRLLDFYLSEESGFDGCGEKCRYIKSVLHFISRRLGKRSEAYIRCRALYLKYYFKYRLFSCIPRALRRGI